MTTASGGDPPPPEPPDEPAGPAAAAAPARDASAAAPWTGAPDAPGDVARTQILPSAAPAAMGDRTAVARSASALAQPAAVATGATPAPAATGVTMAPAAPAGATPAPVAPATAGAAPALAAPAATGAAPAPAAPAATGAAPTATTTRAATVLVDDPSLPELPARYDERELRAAAGGPPRARRAASTERDADEAPAQRRTSRLAVVAAVTGLVAVAAGGFAVAGQLNRGRYVLSCEAERAVPEQGRGFPPWGTRAMAGEPWRPLAITRETRCRPLDTDDVLVLERVYLGMIVGRAAELLTARDAAKLDDADALLQQALLLSRPPVSEPDALAKQRSEQRELIERMLGDVAYGRATARLRDAAAALGEAARLYEAAASQRPRYASDAAVASAYVRAVARDLHTGPLGATLAAASAPGAPRGAAPAGAPTPLDGVPGTAHAVSGMTTTSGTGSAGVTGSAAPPAPVGATTTGSAAAPGTVGATSTGSAAAPGTGGAGATGSTTAPGTVASSGTTAPGTVASSGSTAAPDSAGPTANRSAAAPSPSPPPPAERPPPAASSGVAVEPDRAPTAPLDAGVSTGGVLL